MKYLKLYEQFDEDWDPFGEEFPFKEKSSLDLERGDYVMLKNDKGLIGKIVKITTNHISMVFKKTSKFSPSSMTIPVRSSSCLRKLSKEEIMRLNLDNYKLTNEQFDDDWDPFGEESEYKKIDIKVGDFVKVEGKRIGFIREYSGNSIKIMFYGYGSSLIIPIEMASKYLEKLTPEEERDYKKKLPITEKFENEEDSWWEEESPFDNLELKRGDIVYIVNGEGRGEIGMILDAGDYLCGVGNKKMYYACRKENIRRATKEEEDTFKNKTTDKDLERW